jgi:hypothetical protein
MKSISFLILSFMLAGFIFPDDSCSSGATVPVTPADGPYVMYLNGKINVFTIVTKNEELKLKKSSYDEDQKAKVIISVATDEEGKSFSFPLQQKLTIQPTDYPEPSKLFILSDIESNFTAFKKLLQEGGVIDANYNWTFGTGHLVLTGDFVDRGSQQWEVLWLIYSLEDKAKAAGGYVHYVLGNHEIMNMSGDLRYLQPKYQTQALLLETGYTQLIGENSELGRWLRTKNVVEKVGDMLFTHGGISSNVNQLNLPLDTINHLVRPYYADSSFHYSDQRTDTLYGETGPFWFRGYYLKTNGHEPAMIDSTLELYKVQHIATGHTIVADTISSWYNGKLFDTDVHHAGGKTEALFKEDGKFYRMVGGEKKLLL